MAEEETNMVGSSFSLVRYNNPVLIDKHQETPLQSAGKEKPSKKGKGAGKGAGSEEPSQKGDDATSDASGTSGKAASGKERSETEEILDSILPPREWEENGQLWRQSVSSTPATRLDVINLQVSLVKSNSAFSSLTVNPPGTTGPKTGAKTGPRDWNLSGQKGTLRSVLRRIDPPMYH